APSVAARPAFLAALARPFLRRNSMALSMSPSTSWSAFLQSIRPAPVASRSSLIIAAFTCAIVLAPSGLGVATLGALGRRSRSFLLGSGGRLGRGQVAAPRDQLHPRPVAAGHHADGLGGLFLARRGMHRALLAEAGALDAGVGDAGAEQLDRPD